MSSETNKQYLLVYNPSSNVSEVDFEYLEKQGIEVEYAIDKKTMIDQMRKREAGVVIASYMSENNNAIDFLRYIMRQHPHTQRVYLTSVLEKDLMENVVNKAHINYLLTFPIDSKSLVNIVKKAFKRYRYLTQPSQRYHDLAGITADLLEDVSKYKSEASLDPLTKLFNRRSFDKILEKTITLFKEKHLPFSLILLDLDDFKQLNDTYGHQAGDEVLRVFGEILQKNMRQEDSAFRYGGEEFAIIASGDISEKIRLFLSRIWIEVKNTKINFEGSDITFAFSAGFTCLRKSVSREELISAADAALYYAKRHGKDQIVDYQDTIGKGD